MQGSLEIPYKNINLGRFVHFEPCSHPVRYKVSGMSTIEGMAIGTIGLKSGGGYEVLLRDDAGNITAHNPTTLFPVLEQSDKDTGSTR